jgi:hypothetical protein
VLLLHVVAGVLALALGPFALAGVGWTVRPYRGLVLVVAATALALVGSSALPGVVRGLLAVVAVGSAAGVLAPSARGLRGSYVALVAALAFVSAPVWVGVVVVAVGSAVVHGVPVRAVVRG